MNSNTVVINIPEKLENNKSSFEFLIYDLHFKTKDIKNSNIILNFKKTRWLEGNLTAILGSIFYGILKNNNELSVQSINKSIGRVLHKNGFLESFGVSKSIEDTYDSTIKYTRFIPDDKINFQKYLKEVFIPKIKLKMTDDFTKELRLNLEEVFQNARTHGKCEHIFVCGQYFYLNKSVKFTIVDLGKTIPDNVRNKLGHQIDDKNCIDWATKEGHSTKTDTSGGIGLYQLSEFLKENEGKLQIVSSYGFWQQDEHSIQKENLEHPFCGTIVNIEVRINDKVYLSSKEKNKQNHIINNIF